MKKPMNLDDDDDDEEEEDDEKDTNPFATLTIVRSTDHTPFSAKLTALSTDSSPSEGGKDDNFDDFDDLDTLPFMSITPPQPQPQPATEDFPALSNRVDFHYATDVGTLTFPTEVSQKEPFELLVLHYRLIADQLYLDQDTSLKLDAQFQEGLREQFLPYVKIRLVQSAEKDRGWTFPTKVIYGEDDDGELDGEESVPPPLLDSHIYALLPSAQTTSATIQGYLSLPFHAKQSVLAIVFSEKEMEGGETQEQWMSMDRLLYGAALGGGSGGSGGEDNDKIDTLVTETLMRYGGLQHIFMTTPVTATTTTTTPAGEKLIPNPIAMYGMDVMEKELHPEWGFVYSFSSVPVDQRKTRYVLITANVLFVSTAEEKAEALKEQWGLTRSVIYEKISAKEWRYFVKSDDHFCKE